MRMLHNLVLDWQDRFFSSTPPSMGTDLFQQMKPSSSKLESNVNPITQASVASLANPITHFITKISGTEAVTGFRVPSGFRGLFVVIPTGAFTGATGGTYASGTVDGYDDVPIGKAFTMIANVAAIFVCDGDLIYPVAMVSELID